MWLLKLLLSLWLIIIKFWSNNNFKKHLIIIATQNELIELPAQLAGSGPEESLQAQSCVLRKVVCNGIFYEK
jgi:hypothetical protein